MRMHEIRDGDPKYVKALKAEWNQIAEKEIAEEAEEKRLSSIALSWSGQHQASLRRLAVIRQNRDRIERALKALRDPSVETEK
jgi:hypothetical protein